ncbi:baculoviral IAP repeat-containing protein 1 isoform X1 [Amia ocellicauda]|uniref:baculoviral IAP repeat-containing protein 1 isoform X1 n=1 Tax=Amia ocellicauda TaxID=2972642 RepID=UPI003463ECD6
MYIEYRQIMDVQNMEPASPASQDPDKSFEYDPKDWALQCHPFLNFSAKVVTQNYEHCLRRMVKGGQQGYNCKMRSELTRLKSFQGFSGLSPFTTEELANAGFFSLQQTAVVQCFNCGLIIGLGSFQPPRELHLKYREDCGFQKGLDVGNIDKYSVRVKVLDSEVKEVSVNCKVERGRFESFASWPFYCDTEPLILAECGFFYTGVKDYVQCFSCRGVLGDWEVGSDPWKEHAKWFPQCDYIRTRLSDSTISEIGRSYIGFHGLTGEHYISCIGKNGETQCIEATLSEDTGLNFFANKDLRMETFTQWPSDSPVSPSKLVQAGFFLTECVSDDGYEEVIQCFCCGGRISQWVEGADPVQEHCKLFPQCQFIANLNRTPQQSFTDPDVTKELNLHPETPVEELLFPSSGICSGLETLEEKTSCLQSILKKAYLRQEFSRSFPCADIHIPFDIRLVYTQLAMVTKNISNAPVSQITLTDLLRELRNITVIDGEAGSGKTTCLKKIAMLWAEGTCPLLSRFKLVFYTPLCSSLESPSERVIEILRDQLGMKELQMTESTLQSLIQHNHDSVLFLLDDFGKHSSPLPALVEKDLIQQNHFWNIPVIVAVRTQSLHLIRKHAQLQVTIQDFPLYGTIHICREMLSYNMSLVEDVYKRLHTHIILQIIFKTPLMGLAACISRIKFPKRVFDAVCILDCYLQLVQKSLTGRTERFNTTVSSIGKLCLRGQFEGKFEFSGEDLLHADVKESEALELGLLNKFSTQRLRPVYRIIHVFFQEYLAAVRMNELLTSDVSEDQEQSQKYLGQIDSVVKFMCFESFLCFTSKMSKTSATVITDFVLNGLNRDTAFNSDEVVKNFCVQHPQVKEAIYYLSYMESTSTTFTDTYLIDHVGLMLFESPYLSTCAPLLTDFMKGKMLVISPCPYWGLSYFINQYPESVTGVKGFHLSISQGFSNWTEEIEKPLSAGELPVVDEQYAIAFSDPEDLKMQKASLTDNLNFAISLFSSLIPKVLVQVLCSVRNAYKIPLMDITIIDTRKVKESDLVNMGILFSMSESVTLDILHSPGVVEKLWTALEGNMSMVKKLSVVDFALNEKEQATLLSLTNLTELKVQILKKGEVPELLLGQLHKFRNLQSVQLGLCKEHIFDMLPIGFSKMRTLRKLHLSIDERANYTMLAWLLKHFTQLSSFTLYCPSCPALLDILDSLPHNSLQELELGIIELTDAQLQHCIPKLGTFSNLKVLQISHEKFDNMEIMTSFGSVLRELRNLEVLHLPHGKGTEAVVESLITACQTLQGLRSLRIHSCLNDENLVRIAKATLEGSFIKLRELLLDWNICTTDRGWWEFFNTLGSLKELEKLSVSMPLEHLLKPSSSTVIAFVRAISQLPRVRHIIVAGWLLDQMDLDMFNAMKKKHPQSQNMILTSKICVNPHILVDD